MPGPSLFIRENCPIATPANDGLMSAAQAAIVAGGITPGGGGSAFQYQMVQPANGNDFIVPIPLAFQQPDGNYAVVPVIASASEAFTGIIIPFADQTGTQFRVITDGTLGNASLLSFTLTHF